MKGMQLKTTRISLFRNIILYKILLANGIIYRILQKRVFLKILNTKSIENKFKTFMKDNNT